MGELEPNDSRNVTGTAVTPDGRWTGQAGRDPNLSAEQLQGQNGISPQQAQQRDDQLRAAAHQQQEAAQQQQQQGGQSGQQSAPQQNMGGSQGAIGQENDGVSGAGNQGNDHTSAIGQNMAAGAAGSGQASYGNSGQPQQFAGDSGQQGGGGGVGGGAGQFADQLAKHQEVVDSNGRHVGTIDHVDGDRIKLTRKDSPDGEHHYVSLSEVEGIESGRVRLSGAAGSGTQA
jgi:hypothetical protein